MKCATSSCETLLHAWRRFMVILSWDSIWSSYQRSIIRTRLSVFVFTMICIQGHGGGEHRCVHHTLTAFIALKVPRPLLEGIREGKSRRNNHSDYYLDRQNTTYAVSQQECIPTVPNNRKHPKRNSPKAIKASIHPLGLPSNHTPRRNHEPSTTPTVHCKLVPCLYAPYSQSS